MTPLTAETYSLTPGMLYALLAGAFVLGVAAYDILHHWNDVCVCRNHPARAKRMLLLMFIAAPAYASDNEPPSIITVSGGVGVAISDDSAAFPEVYIEADTPMYLFDERSVGRLRARLELLQLPGDAVQEDGPSLLTPEIFRAAGGSLAYSFRIGKSPMAADGSQQSVYVEIAAEAWTRFVTRDERPRDRLAKAISAGVRVERRTLSGNVERFVSARWGRSDVASPSFGAGQVIVEGRAQLYNYRGTSLSVGARIDADVLRAPGGRDRFEVYTHIAN